MLKKSDFVGVKKLLVTYTGYHCGPQVRTETNNWNKQNEFKNYNWPEAKQVAICSLCKWDYRF